MKDIEKIIFISDLHFGVRSNSLEFLEIQKEYYYKFFIPNLKKLSRKHKILVVCLGDIFESKQILNVRVLNEAIQIFEDISKICTIITIVGNHDIFQKNSFEINSIKPLSLIENVKLLDATEILQIGPASKKFYFMPWQFTKDEEKNCIDEALKNKCNYLLCHTEIKGLKYNRFITCSGGNEMEAYNGFDKVISGHIHWRQDQSNILYIGNPYHTNKGDRGNKKGIYVLDTVSGNFQFIENNLSPEYVKLKLAEILEEDTLEVIHKIKNNFIEIEYSSDYIKFPFYKLIDQLEEHYRSLEYYSENEGGITNDIIDEEDNIDLGDFAELKQFNLLELIASYIEEVSTIKEFKDKMRIRSEELYSECLSNSKDDL